MSVRRPSDFPDSHSLAKVAVSGPLAHPYTKLSKIPDWVNWFKILRLLEPIGHIPPTKLDEIDYQYQNI